MRALGIAQSRQFAVSAFCLTALVLCAGCSRAWWRQQADDEVQATVAEKHGQFDLGTIAPAADSRLADPFDPDEEPLPPDDPQSHELMHEVNGHRGWKHWHDRGSADSVDFGQWLDSLPRNEDGDVVINLPEAMRVARKNSREYQSELEDLYLSALDVTFQRFRFDTQFFLGNQTTQQFDGVDRGRSRSELETTNSAQLQQLTATGGQFVVGLANSFVWQFSGQDSDQFGSVLNFAITQPLLRFGGRARVLEQLTQTERTLLANVRQMEQYRRGFYVNIVAGRNSGDGPNRAGNVGQGGLGLIAGLPSGRSGAAPVGGFLGVLQEAQQIRNRDANLAALRDSVIQLEARFEAGWIPIRLQVDQTRQAYFNAMSNQLSSRAGYASRLDAFKMSLGLPPSLPLIVQDPLIDRFNLIEPEFTGLLDEVNDVLDVLREKSRPAAEIQLADRHRALLEFEERVRMHLSRTGEELEKFTARLPQRLGRLKYLQERIIDQKHSVDVRLFDPDALVQRVREHTVRLKDNRAQIEELFVKLKAVPAKELKESPDDAREKVEDLAIELSGFVLDAMLTQASVRLEAIELVPVEMSETEALQTASEHRLDWMNARANLVDAWRKIEFDGNALQSDLTLRLSGDVRTRGDNPAEVNFDDSRLNFGFEFDTPVTRLQERNRYRETLIGYQRARRSYMLFEDQLTQSLRNTLRIIDLSQINFEIRRTAVQIAISQVTLARMRLNEPQKGVGAGNTVSPTTARDLVSALNDLLDSQNDLLNAWVSFEVLRMLLDFELGTMRLSDAGLWVDPGSVMPPDRAIVPIEPGLPLVPPDPAKPDAPPLPEDRSGMAAQPKSGWRATTSRIATEVRVTR